MNSPTEEQAAAAPSPGDDDATALMEQEQKIRDDIARSAVGANPVAAFVVNIYSSIIIFAFHLISLESIMSMALSVGMTVAAYYITDNSTSFDGSAMDWVLLSFAVITPMSASIGMAFTRREKALDHLAVIKTTLWNIYSAHACWNWKKPGNPNSGRAALPYDWMAHTDEVLRAILGICNETNRLLTLPEDSRSRHRSTPTGRAEAVQLGELRSRLHWRIYGQVTKLTDMCEAFKVQGLPPNEATRVRQWERFVTERIEMLVMIKKYRTPQALRSFARLFWKEMRTSLLFLVQWLGVIALVEGWVAPSLFLGRHSLDSRLGLLENEPQTALHATTAPKVVPGGRFQHTLAILTMPCTSADKIANEAILNHAFSKTRKLSVVLRANGETPSLARLRRYVGEVYSTLWDIAMGKSQHVEDDRCNFCDVVVYPQNLPNAAPEQWINKAPDLDSVCGHDSICGWVSDVMLEGGLDDHVAALNTERVGRSLGPVRAVHVYPWPMGASLGSDSCEHVEFLDDEPVESNEEAKVPNISDSCSDGVCELPTERSGELISGTHVPTESLFEQVAVGGTFDGMHYGHRKLLTLAVSSVNPVSGKLTVGVTVDEMLRNKAYSEQIPKLQERMDGVREFLHRLAPGLKNRIRVFAISDEYGPPGSPTDAEGFDALVLSHETLENGQRLNEHRQKNLGLPPLALLCTRRTEPHGMSRVQSFPQTILQAKTPHCRSAQLAAGTYLKVSYVAPDLADGDSLVVTIAEHPAPNALAFVREEEGKDTRYSQDLIRKIKPVTHSIEKQEGSLSHHVKHDSEVRICVKGSSKLDTPTRFGFLVDETGDEEGAESGLSPAESVDHHLSFMESQFDRIESQMHAMLKEADFARERDSIYHSKTDAMHKATLFWPVVHVGILLVTGFTQANHIVQFFKKRRII
eukprot:Nitzschia sp. Nitz4//scaffold76_size158648//25046//29105//NITZ4_002534-RA/size158648-processed-gene-0.231-mRNA-1//1//CDS//3329557809//8624//frame0